MPGLCENHLYVGCQNERKYDTVPEVEDMPESDGSGSDPLIDSDSFSGRDQAPGDENRSVNQDFGNHDEMSEKDYSSDKSDWSQESDQSTEDQDDDDDDEKVEAEAERYRRWTTSQEDPWSAFQRREETPLDDEEEHESEEDMEGWDWC